MFNFIAWIVLGALAGWLASIIMKRNQQQGLLMDIVVGIAGAFIGGFIVDLLFDMSVGGFNLVSIAVSVAGAVLLLWIMGKVQGGKKG